MRPQSRTTKSQTLYRYKFKPGAYGSIALLIAACGSKNENSPQIEYIGTSTNDIANLGRIKYSKYDGLAGKDRLIITDQFPFDTIKVDFAENRIRYDNASFEFYNFEILQTVGAASVTAILTQEVTEAITGDGSDNILVNSSKDLPFEVINNSYLGTPQIISTQFGNDVVEFNGFYASIDGGGGEDELIFANIVFDTIEINTAKNLVKFGGNTSHIFNFEIFTVHESAYLNFIGSSKAETVFGSLNNDTFDPKGGGDHLTGGAGSDTYIFSTVLANGLNTILDFTSGINGDLLKLKFESGAENNEIIVVDTTDDQRELLNVENANYTFAITNKGFTSSKEVVIDLNGPDGIYQGKPSIITDDVFIFWYNIVQETIYVSLANSSLNSSVLRDPVDFLVLENTQLNQLSEILENNLIIT